VAIAAMNPAIVANHDIGEIRYRPGERTVGSFIASSQKDNPSDMPYYTFNVRDILPAAYSGDENLIVVAMARVARKAQLATNVNRVVTGQLPPIRRII
jgi:hypothetical protein